MASRMRGFLVTECGWSGCSGCPYRPSILVGEGGTKGMARFVAPPHLGEGATGIDSPAVLGLSAPPTMTPSLPEGMGCAAAMAFGEGKRTAPAVRTEAFGSAVGLEAWRPLPSEHSSRKSASARRRRL